MQVGEVAAASPGDQYLLPDLLGVFEHGHTPAPFARLDGAHKTGGPGAEDDGVKLH